MAIKAKVLKTWVETLSDDDTVVINTGEMSVETEAGNSQCTVGGHDAASTVNETTTPPKSS